MVFLIRILGRFISLLFFVRGSGRKDADQLGLRVGLRPLYRLTLSQAAASVFLFLPFSSLPHVSLLLSSPPLRRARLRLHLHRRRPPCSQISAPPPLPTPRRRGVLGACTSACLPGRLASPPPPPLVRWAVKGGLGLLHVSGGGATADLRRPTSAAAAAADSAGDGSPG